MKIIQKTETKGKLKFEYNIFIKVFDMDFYSIYLIKQNNIVTETVSGWQSYNYHSELAVYEINR